MLIDERYTSIFIESTCGISKRNLQLKAFDMHNLFMSWDVLQIVYISCAELEVSFLSSTTFRHVTCRLIKFAHTYISRFLDLFANHGNPLSIDNFVHSYAEWSCKTHDLDNARIDYHDAQAWCIRTHILAETSITT